MGSSHLDVMWSQSLLRVSQGPPQESPERLRRVSGELPLLASGLKPGLNMSEGSGLSLRYSPLQFIHPLDSNYCRIDGFASARP